MKKITLLIPCYNEEASLPALYDRVTQVIGGMPQYEWQLLLVNDGSTDGTLSVLADLRARDPRVCYIDLSRNFGKESAMLAGFDHASGDAVVVMDADLQHPPEVIGQLLEGWEEGYDDVYARRESRGREPLLRRWLSLAYYHLLQHSTRLNVLPNVGDFRLLDRKCIDALKGLRERARNTKGLYAWIGFKKKEITFVQGDRKEGKSSFNIWRLLKLAMDGITSFTTAPLRIATLLGLIVSLGAFFYMCYVLVKTLIMGDPVAGFPTLIVAILFLSGVQLLSIGIIGEYLGRVFIETKERPVYLIREKQGV
ncbi:MAG: glycosyltransferase family 2 protein [Muribaculaceae bacterium]|nr:glycosyltransferase family 2 protein [Muribaculaceae bacterium]